MRQAVIAMRKRDSEAVIAALQNAGVLHLRPLESDLLSEPAQVGEVSEELREAERLLARIESTLAELGAEHDDSVTVALPPRAEWSGAIDNVADEVAALSKNQSEASADLDAAQGYAAHVGELVRHIAPLEGSRRIEVLPFVLPPEASEAELKAVLAEMLPERHELVLTNANGQRAGAIAVLNSERDAARGVLSRVRLSEMRLPGRFEGMRFSEAAPELEAIRRDGKARLHKLTERRQSIAKAHAPTLFALRDQLRDIVAVHDVRHISARGRYSLVMQGYIPTARLPELNAALAGFGDAVHTEVFAVDEHHDHHVPVQLHNNDYVRPFQLTLGMASLPKYGSFDPTWVIAIFFPLFFGIIIADMGYGLLFLWAGMKMMDMAKRGQPLRVDFMDVKIAPPALRDLAYVTNVMAIWTIVWGFLTGEFFGTLFEHLGIFRFDPNVINTLWGWTGIHAHAHEAAHAFNLPFHINAGIPILFPRLETALFGNIFLVFSLLFGVLQVLWGWGIRIQQGIKHKDSVHTWEGIALFGGVFALVALAFATKAGGDMSQLSNFGNPMTLLMLAGFVAFFVGWIKVIKEFPLLPIEMLSQGGAVVSYARIFAVGLVSAILAKLCTEAGLALSNHLGVVGFFLGLVISAVLHGLVLVMTLIGHILQPLRLHVIEFLNPTGFNNETSPAYAPLRRLAKATPADASSQN